MMPRSILLCLSFCCFCVTVVQAKYASVRGGLPIFDDTFTAGVAVSDASIVISDEDPWAAVTKAINDYHMTDFAVVVANASGIQYLYEKGNISYTDTVMSKWITSLIAILSHCSFSHHPLAASPSPLPRRGQHHQVGFRHHDHARRRLWRLEAERLLPHLLPLVDTQSQRPPLPHPAEASAILYVGILSAHLRLLRPVLPQFHHGLCGMRPRAV